MKTLLKVKGILLDLDGTIVDSREAYFEAARTALAAMGQTVPDSEIVTEIPKRLEQDMPIHDLIPAVARERAKRFQEVYLKTYYQATMTRTKPFPHAAETLKQLSMKAKLALTTRRNVPMAVVIEELERFGLAKYFHCIMTSLDTQNPKPSPEALMICSRRLNVGIPLCLVVGDSVVDVRAGKNAGARTAAVLSGIFTRDELEKEKPDLILENINELPGFLE